MIVNWENEFILRSASLGDLTFNESSSVGPRYVILPGESKDTIPLRVTTDDIPQADGSIHHDRFTAGYQTSITVQLWDGNDCAAGSVLTDLADDLMGHLYSMLNEEGRLLWVPYFGYAGGGGGGYRMYDEIRWNETAEWSMAEAGFTQITFGVDSPFPYAIDATQQTHTVTTGNSPYTLTNTGNTNHYPVLKIYGAPTNSFTIENTTTGEQIVYDEALPGGIPIPGGGQYGEIDTFRNTFYLNGAGASLKAGLVVEQSEFFQLVPGANVLTTDGPTFDVLFNPPWI